MMESKGKKKIFLRLLRREDLAMSGAGERNERVRPGIWFLEADGCVGNVLKEGRSQKF
jgi:hypothetical protein